MSDSHTEILHSKEMEKLVSLAQEIEKTQTAKLRSITSRILQKSFKEKIEPNPWGTVAAVAVLGVVSAIKKSQNTYRPGEFGDSVRKHLTSNKTQLEHSQFHLNSALGEIKNCNTKKLFQVLKINIEQGPSETIKFLLRPIGEIVVESKAINISE